MYLRFPNSSQIAHEASGKQNQQRFLSLRSFKATIVETNRRGSPQI